MQAVQQAEALADYQGAVHRAASLQQLMFYHAALYGCFVGALDNRGPHAPALLAAVPGALRVRPPAPAPALGALAMQCSAAPAACPLRAAGLPCEL